MPKNKKRSKAKSKSPQANTRLTNYYLVNGKRCQHICNNNKATDSNELNPVSNPVPESTADLHINPITPNDLNEDIINPLPSSFPISDNTNLNPLLNTAISTDTNADIIPMNPLSSQLSGQQSNIYQCRSIALKGTKYCRHHIKLHQEDYNQFLTDKGMMINGKLKSAYAPEVQRNIVKYEFLQKELPTSYKTFMADENSGTTINLKNEIAYLSALLQANVAINLDKVSDHRVIDTQLKIIDQIRMLIKTMRELDEGRKVNVTFSDVKFFMMNVCNIIKTYVTEPETQQRIAKDVIDLYNQNLNQKSDMVPEQQEKIIYAQ